MAEEMLTEFRQRIMALTGLDLGQYKPTQLTRRLNGAMLRHRAPDYRTYLASLEQDPRLLREFLDYLTINVSEFLRNPEKFQDLKERYLPPLLEGRGPFRAWSAGCSIGAEPYSLALILDELGAARRSRILATDLDRGVLERANAGIYPKDDLKNVSTERLARYFVPEEQGYRVSPALKAIVEFRRHNLLQDSFERDLDLILCRNVVIYFTEEAKDTLFRRFAQSLRPGGLLFVGGTESIFRAREMGLKMLAPFFYRKEAAA
ncbi:MAG: protein-glutamate O-methyltransferase CheR [Thermaerobacter sp.]|nr:protein-glutamate O-methyltransferase CheR [Thermaerobacter sp.]